METPHQGTALFHLPGLFEFYDLYAAFLPLYRAHREYFYDWCAIGSIYGGPSDCLWAGGRVEYSDRTPREVLALTQEYGISARLTLSNSLLRPEHLTDPDCNALCRLFQEQGNPQNGAIVHAELLTKHLKKELSIAVSCLLNHKSADRLQRSAAGTGAAGVSLCRAGFPAEPGV